MGSSSLKVYFKYVQQVLGIKQIISKNLPLSSHSRPESIAVLIAVNNLRNYNLEENSLLEKMVSALKLQPEQVIIIDLGDPVVGSSYRLNLVDELPAESEVGSTQYTTFSPRCLLQNPELKKQAWSVMQSLLQKINT